MTEVLISVFDLYYKALMYMYTAGVRNAVACWVCPHARPKP